MFELSKWNNVKFVWTSGGDRNRWNLFMQPYMLYYGAQSALVVQDEGFFKQWFNYIETSQLIVVLFADVIRSTGAVYCDGVDTIKYFFNWDAANYK